jgi:CRP-like cAMP-binding protein
MRYFPITRKKFAAGEIIFSERSEGDGMYIIESGKVRVFKTVVSGSGFDEMDLCTLGPKAMFGEMAIIDENPRSASVQALVPTVCTLITRKVFEEQLRHIPPWMVGMIKILVMRLRETNDRLRNSIEQSGSPPPADTGRVITVDEDVAAPDSGAQRAASENGSAAGADRRYKSDDIVKDLYK